MVELQRQPNNQPAEFNYHLLRYALERFSRNLMQLEAAEYEQILVEAEKSFALETQVISTPEASDIVITDRQLDDSIAAIAARYTNHDEFVSDLRYNGLSENTLRHALYRELLFDSVLQRVAAGVDEVTELDARLFYEIHYERFFQAEQRRASHVLITVNPDFPENTADKSRQRIHEVHNKLAGRCNRFADFAKRYSECPTAMEAGSLGTLKRGQLYPELDGTLFAMPEKTISEPVRSELGWHILYCEKVIAEKQIPYTRAAAGILRNLTEQQQRRAQKQWLESLQQTDSTADVIPTAKQTR